MKESKSSEETSDKIIKVSYNLFVQKGYEKGCTAKEKLRYILVKLVGNENINNTNKFLINQSNNSKVIMESIIQTVNHDSYEFYILIKEGVEDGSIKTDFPRECAELLLLLCNVWLNPILFNRTYEETINRFRFIQFTMKQLGGDIIDNELLGKIEENLKGVGINEINQ